MSFGGFGGFGQQNNQQSTGSTFGGFGTNNNSNTGFGASNTGGFGSNNNSGGLFGANNQQNNAGGFGSSGFGSNTANNAFGANKPAFGSTTANTGGSLFGSSNNNTTGGFGSGGSFGATANNTTSPFGGGNTGGGGLFGSNNTQNKPAFGAATTGGSLFGNTGGASTGGFGSGGFGTSTNTLGAGATGDPPGTAVTPFQAFTEKEANSTTQNAFQNIVFQDPYKKWSPEELRLADYAQGRKQGNPSGAGAFGQSSGFGGFGSNTASNTQQSTGFGATANKPATGLFGNSSGGGFGQTGTTGGFGATNTTNNLFGGNNNTANKPANSLFGASNTNTTQTGGGLFGGGNTSGGFGNNATSGFGASNTNTGTGLFGNNTQNQQKPATTGFSFGNNTANNTATSGFGSTNTTATGGFGSTTNAGGGLFGNNNNNQQQQGTGGLFGNNSTQQNNTGTGFGSSFGQQNQAQSSGTSLFGNNQQKPAGGLFGSSTTTGATGGSLFGNTNNQQQQNTGGFGAANNANAGGSLFNKAGTGGGLFGGNTATQGNNTGGGLFGGLGSNQTQQQNASGGLFGGMNNQNQQKPGGLFGSSTQSTGMFGNQNNQSQGLFGGNSQQQQSQGLGNSLLGNSQQSNNAPQGLTANLNDISAYGSPSLFAGVGGSEVANPGPLATSLNGSSKPKRNSVLPLYKLAPASASRFATPQKRGFGFSYSTYGTPGVSPASSISSTPGTLGRSLLGASSSGSLSKSMSTNNLRRTYNAEDSILNPGAFSSSSGSRWYGSTGSKKLVINRDIRSDLFSTPQKDKSGIDVDTGSRKLSKRVSFDTSNAEAEEGTPVRAALPAPEDVPRSPEETPRQNRTTATVAKTPEIDPASGKELAIVHEEEANSTPGAQNVSGFDNAPGKYWMQPSLENLQNMNRMQRQKIDGLTVGRDNIGTITFKVPVDMSSIDLEELCGGIIQLEPRSATVYPIAAKKPPVGKGLNVPARISLEQSWPRGGRDKRVASDPKRFNKHVDRLRRIPDTEFESYDKDTGVWTFSVEHFTTYGLDDSDDESEADAMEQEPADILPPPTSRRSVSETSDDSLMEDDTFDFRRHRAPPGAFDDQDQVFEDVTPSRQSFLGVSSADSAPQDVRLSLEDEYVEDQGEGYDLSYDEGMARSSVGQHLAAEQDDVSLDGGPDTHRGTPGGVLRARMRAMKDSAGPLKVEIAEGDDWMEMLRNTVSPVKRNRQQLRELNDSPTRQPAFDEQQRRDPHDPVSHKTSVWGRSVANTDRMGELAASKRSVVDKGRGFATSIDLMNSLFEKPKPQQDLRASTSSKGFPKWPYERQDKDLAMSESEQAFHDAGRPTWGPQETLVVTSALSQRHDQSIRDGSGVMAFQRPRIETESQVVRLANFSTLSTKRYLRSQDRLTKIELIKDVPFAKLETKNVKELFHQQDLTDPASVQEKWVWELASILFDDLDVSEANSVEQTRKSRLSKFWTDLVHLASSSNIGLAASSEEKAVACLAGHRVAEACKYLVDSRNFRLGTLVALIGTSDAAKKDMREQLKSWQNSRMLSEFPEAIRTIYELLSGNVGVCEGIKGVPAEDRIESFVISSKFGLDWKQAFGLRLWYAIATHDNLSAAVRLFKTDIEQDKESNPAPWFVDQGIQPLWSDEDADSRQDLLWGLLQLYADEQADLEAVLRPENSQLSPLDMRLSWQLGLALSGTGKVSYGQNGSEKADAITVAYASQLTSVGEWLEAVFVLLHLSASDARARAIQEHLCRHASLIGPESGDAYVTLTQKFHVPASWVWEAKALYMRSVKKDASGEVECLLRAGSFAEAHRVLVQQVAPRAIVERDYVLLSSLLSQFEGRQDTISGWSSGGEIYSYFLDLLQHRSRGEALQAALLDRLLAGLHAMSDSAPDSDLMRYAAVSDMADEAAKEILKQAKLRQDIAEIRSKILNLPLTQDRRLAYSMDLGNDRKREIMSH